jgi:hypothetical protein
MRVVHPTMRAVPIPNRARLSLDREKRNRENAQRGWPTTAHREEDHRVVHQEAARREEDHRVEGRDSLEAHRVEGRRVVAHLVEGQDSLEVHLAGLQGPHQEDRRLTARW